MRQRTKAELQYLLAQESEAHLRMARKVTELEIKLQTRVDTSMIKERQDLLNSIGQLVEAVSKAIVYTVGKEVL